MIRIWDIVDKVDPGTPIVVERPTNRRPLTGFASSAAQIVFAVSLAVAASVPFVVKRPAYHSNFPARAQAHASAEDVMTPEIAGTLAAMRTYSIEADVANLEPEDEEPIGYSYPV